MTNVLVDDLNEQIADLPPAKRALLELRLRQKKKGAPRAAAIPRRASPDSAPLSSPQQRLWFLNELDPDNSAYNISHAFRIKGALNAPALKDALNEIVRRHEVLRTRFGVIDGESVQLVDEIASVSLLTVDLRDLHEAERDIEARRLIREEAKHPFELSQGPLFRVCLFQLTNEDYVLKTTIHHIVSDGWSMGLLFRELTTLYEALANGKSSPLVELPVQYADFAEWQRKSLESEYMENQLTYWRNKLEGAPAVLELPTDRPRPAIGTFRGLKKSTELSPSITKALNELSRREGVTLFMTLLAAFKTLLWRYTRHEDVIVGLPIAGRTRAEIEGLIGFFVNSLVLRTDLSGNPEFLQLLGRVRETTLEAYANQDLPFEKLVEALQPERSLSHTPLFQVALTFQNAPRARLELDGLKLESMGIENQTSKFDLTIFAAASEEGVSLTFEYNTDLFDDSRIERMMEHFKILLGSIVANPEARISELEILPETERQKILVEWNQTATSFPPEICIHRMFEEQVSRDPNQVAVVFEDQQLTYAELNARANQLARYLRSLGVGPETLVGIYIERSLEMVIGLLGILKAGGAYVPLDPAFPRERLAYMIEDAAVPVLLTSAALSRELPAHSAKIVLLDADQRVILRGGAENLAGGATVENLAYVIYTSGSTGRPKGTMNTHAGLYNRLLWMQAEYELTESDRVLQKTPYSFDVSVWEFFWPLITGARLVVAQPGGHQDPHYLVNTIQQHQISTLHFVPSMLEAFVEENQMEQCHSVRQVISSGEALSFELQERFFDRLSAKLHNLYGPTEASIDVTAWECERGAACTVPIGQPIANTQVYILDEMLQPVPIGVAGELHIGGTGLGRGYLKRPDLTAEKFVPNPYAEGQRIYKTGDLARYLQDGNIEYLGRIDHQVKIRGFRIELGEIEAALREYPQVSTSVVILNEDASGDRRLVAYVVSEESGLNDNELREYLRQRLPEYMVPAAIVELEELPLTPSGKIDRRALPAPQQFRQELEARFEAPHSPTEEVLASIWSEILKVDRVGIHDNFFDLGGHSLVATRVIARMRVAFGTELPLRLMFDSPTIAALANIIEKGMRHEEGPEPPPLVRASREENLPASFAQQRLWFLDQLEQGSSFYHISRAFRVSGNLNVDALASAINEIVRRHEPLRTSFVSVDGMPLQRIEEPQPILISQFALEQVPESDRDNEVQRLAQAQIRKPFDLTSGPMLRASLIKTGQAEWVFVLTIHHIAGDAWTLSILFKELGVLYAAFAQGNPSPLPDLKIQFVDFAVWQRSWLQGEVMEKHLSYWKRQLAGAPAILELPTDKPRPAEQTFRGERLRFDLSPELTGSLKAMSKREGVTLFMTSLAAFQVLLSRYTGQTELLVGTDVANRNRVETEAMIGFFVNLLPLRISLSENPTFIGLLRQVREVTLRAYAHQDVPFERLVAEFRPKRDLSRNPLVQVLLVMQNTPAQELEMEGLTLAPFELSTESSRFDLALFFWESGAGISGSYLYNPDLFNANTIERMSDHFKRLLESIVADPAAQVDTFKLKTDEELREEEQEKRDREQLHVYSLRDTRRRGVDLSSGKGIKTTS